MATPSFTMLPIEGSGDVYTYVGSVLYSNGQTWQMIAVIELRAGKIREDDNVVRRAIRCPGLAGSIRRALSGTQRLANDGQEASAAGTREEEMRDPMKDLLTFLEARGARIGRGFP